MEKGSISVNAQQIFPIIKKFLYSDEEIFIRELVANAVDATQKIQKLASIGEFNGELGDLAIRIKVNAKLKTITFSDRGVGMTAEEIKKYINQIAFSGATEFIERYKNVEDTNQIIGKFGLGFYSAFMVAEKVDIITQSYQEESEAVQWSCKGETDFEINKAVKKERGTDIVLHLAEDAKAYLEESKIQSILNKYCRFLPIQIIFGTKEETVKDEQDKEKKVKKDNIINDTKPLWTVNPKDITDEQYLEFYKSLYPFAPDPLFWIHLNVDYPFNLTGILYFPKLKDDFTVDKNKIQLYSRQVFITDEVKDIVPEFLMLLHGVIDSPDIPLNVSRSYLQSDSNVKKINNYISKKVAETLDGLFKNDRKSFEAKWKDIGLFIKYGMISDEKFGERAKKFCLLENLASKKFTFDEYLEEVQANQTDKNNLRVLLYSNDPAKQDVYIQQAKTMGYDVLSFDKLIDNHFIQVLETKLDKVQVKRVDADIVSKLIEQDTTTEAVLSEAEQTKIKEIYKTVIGQDKANLQVESMGTDNLPVTITFSEYMRRMKEMSKFNTMGGMGMDFPDQQIVNINGNHTLITKILNMEDNEERKQLVQQTYDLALLSQDLLQGKTLTDFVNRSLGFLA